MNSQTCFETNEAWFRANIFHNFISINTIKFYFIFSLPSYSIIHRFETFTNQISNLRNCIEIHNNIPVNSFKEQTFFLIPSTSYYSGDYNLNSTSWITIAFKEFLLKINLLDFRKVLILYAFNGKCIRFPRRHIKGSCGYSKIHLWIADFSGHLNK